jgi:3-oxoacyl-[acyl-carrier protein] reductase
MSGILQDRVAIVTGAAGGIGRAVALRFAREGAKIALLDKARTALEETASLVTQAGGEVYVSEIDLTQIEDIGPQISAAANSLGGIDIVYNNAGVSIARQIEDTDEGFWDFTQAINVKAPLFVVKHALPYLRKSAHPVVINVGSVSGSIGLAGMSAYCTSKGAIHQLTKAMAVEFAPLSIRVNAIAPGVVATEMATAALAHLCAEEREQTVRNWTSRQLFKRAADPDEIASVAIFLASDQSSVMTGEILNASAGWTAN